MDLGAYVVNDLNEKQLAYARAILAVSVPFELTPEETNATWEYLLHHSKQVIVKVDAHIRYLKAEGFTE